MLNNIFLEAEAKKSQGSDLVVFQHNNITQAKYILTLQERRVVLWLSSQVKSSDKDFQDHEISVKDFCNVSGLKSKNMYKEIEQTIKSLMGKSLEIKSLHNSSWELISWLSYAKYVDDEGIVTLRFDPALKPYLLELKSCFTQFSLSQALSLKSIYSVRLYEMLSQFYSIGEVVFSVQEIKEKFLLEKGKYNDYKNFKRRVIERACSEITLKSNLSVRFVEIKKNKKVESIKFFVDAYNKFEKLQDNIFHDCQTFDISLESLNLLVQEFSEESVKQGLSVLKQQKSKIKSPVAFLKKAIKKGWQPIVKEEKQTTHDLQKSYLTKEIDTLTEDQTCIIFRKNILENVGDSEYKSWFRELYFFMEGSQIVIRVHSQFIKNWLDTNYSSLLADCSDGRVVIVRFVEKTMPMGGMAIDPNEHKLHGKKKMENSKKKVQSNQKEKKGQQINQVPKKSLWQKIKNFWK